MYRLFLAIVVVAVFHFLFLPSISYAVFRQGYDDYVGDTVDSIPQYNFNLLSTTSADGAVHDKYGSFGRLYGMSEPNGLVRNGLTDTLYFHPSNAGYFTGEKLYTNFSFTHTKMSSDRNMDTSAVGFSFDETLNNRYTRRNNYWNAEVAYFFGLGPGTGALYIHSEVGDSNLNGDGEREGFTNELIDVEAKSNSYNNGFNIFYGQVLENVRIGWQLGVSHQNKDNDYSTTERNASVLQTKNDLSGNLVELTALPLDINRTDLIVKVSVGKTSGPVDLDFTLSMNKNLSGRFNWSFMEADSLWTGSTSIYDDMDGHGGGGDLWLKYKQSKSLSYNFWLRGSYNEMEFDGDARGDHNLDDTSFVLNSSYRRIFGGVGGGLVYEPNDNTLVAVGFSYDYMKNWNTVRISEQTTFDTTYIDYNNGWRSGSGNIVKGRGVVEWSVSSDFAWRLGFFSFYGCVENDPESEFRDSFGSTHQAHDIKGKTFGAGLSVGTTFSRNWSIFEPYFKVEYRSSRKNDEGNGFADGVNTDMFGGKKESDEASLTIGFAVKF